MGVSLDFNNQKTEDKIEHVGDTALMVAACRAMETAQPDGLIRDPFAERLAGERGMAIARAVPMLEGMRFGVGIRARSMDEILAGVLSDGRIKTVLNLGSGLDTRPWRLRLPPALHWIEADFPAMLEYKAANLAGERPRCRFEQVSANLANTRDRQKVFERAGAGEALMITEGLLMYLPRAGLTALATEAPQLSGVRHWLLDVTSKELMRVTGGGNEEIVEKLRPRDHLAGKAILDAASQSGWRVAKKTLYEETVGAGRTQKLAEMMLKKMDLKSIPKGDGVSGIYLLEWAASK